MEAPVEAPGEPKPSLTGSKIWLAVWTLLTALLCFVLATAAPNSGHPATLGLMVTASGMFSRLLELNALASTGKPPRWWQRWRRRLGAVFLGLIVAGVLGSWLGQRSMASFEAAMAPLVAQVHTQAAAPCPPAAQYTLDPALRDYVRSRLWGLSAAQLYHRAGHFVLRFPGGSIDIDGSTVWYDSATRRWSQFHNDISEPREAFEALIGPMTACRLPLR